MATIIEVGTNKHNGYTVAVALTSGSGGGKFMAPEAVRVVEFTGDYNGCNGKNVHLKSSELQNNAYASYNPGTRNADNISCAKECATKYLNAVNSLDKIDGRSMGKLFDRMTGTKEQDSGLSR